MPFSAQAAVDRFYARNRDHIAAEHRARRQTRRRRQLGAATALLYLAGSLAAGATHTIFPLGGVLALGSLALWARAWRTDIFGDFLPSPFV